MLGNNKAIGGGGFHHVAMRAKDWDASVKFYKDVLGFTEWIRWGKPAEGDQADTRAIMLDTGDGSHMEIFANGTGQAPEGSYIHVAFNTTDCDGAIARARAARCKITMEPKSLTIDAKPAPVNVRIGFCLGPDNEVIEFFQCV